VELNTNWPFSESSCLHGHKNFQPSVVKCQQPFCSAIVSLVRFASWRTITNDCRQLRSAPNLRLCAGSEEVSRYSRTWRNARLALVVMGDLDPPVVGAGGKISVRVSTPGLLPGYAPWTAEPMMSWKRRLPHQRVHTVCLGFRFVRY
jgi:hypothetical protein